MAGAGVIDDYVAALAAQLPASDVTELADGLDETRARYAAGGLAPDEAARAAIAEFGRPEVVVAAYVAASPVRRAARRLALTGPLVGLCWATALVVNHVWTWPAPALAPVVPGALLLGTIALLVAAAFGTRYRAVLRAGTMACVGIAAVDATMLVVALLATVLVTGVVWWPVLVAATASAARIVFSVRSLRTARAA